MDKNKLMSHKTFFYLMAAAFAILGILRALFEDTPERAYAVGGIAVVAAIILAIIGKVGGKKTK
ncbi:hypothetical protein [Herbaspirillum sp. RV1423]|uniref:hypothetical protein n=1 Tax=Herbaspirillum sp. RV1423 TaxID=1443993 RepID=UPI0004B2B226|nr:hypothetical protein [Herbaspirillum sp. RV1423]